MREFSFFLVNYDLICFNSLRLWVRSDHYDAGDTVVCSRFSVLRIPLSDFESHVFGVCTWLTVTLISSCFVVSVDPFLLWLGKMLYCLLAHIWFKLFFSANSWNMTYSRCLLQDKFAVCSAFTKRVHVSESSLFLCLWICVPLSGNIRDRK